jgi:hypothetical protein
MATKKADDVSIGKFDVLATYTYTKALLAGADDSAAKERGMVAAIMGARAKLGPAGSGHEDYQADKKVAEKKKKTTITAGSFDSEVSGKIGKYFDTTFLPAIKRLVEAGLSYEEVKRLIGIPATWGAKISGEQFRRRAIRKFRGGVRAPDGAG